MIPWVISPYSFDGSVVRFEKLVRKLKEKGLKSVLLADKNFHAAVQFNELMRREGLIPVHGLWRGERVLVALSRRGFDSLVRLYNGEDERLEDVVAFDVKDLKPIRYLEPQERDAYVFMRNVFGLEAEEGQGFEGELEDISSLLGTGSYDLRVKQKLPSPPPDWYERLRAKAFEMGPEYVERFEREREVIERKGLGGYIHTVERIVETARKLGIGVGPGRGSAVGSLFVYLCGITDVDPLKHGLLFERFVNEERNEPPDIDVDVEDRKRKELIRELSKQFHVYQISTFGTLGEKSLRNFEAYLEGYPEVRKKRIAEAVLGLPIHRSVHAAGIVVSEEPLSVPFRMEEGIPILDYDMYSLEILGIVKTDVLGLRTISFVKDIGTNVTNFDDEATYEMIARGETLGVFQLESLNARRLCRKISPKDMEDLSVLLALNRPGPLMSKLDELYRTPKGIPRILREMFPETKGVPVYQEQLMVLSMFAGLTGSEADTLRRAIAKKEREKVEELLEKLKKGLEEKGVEDVESLLKVFLNFSAYAFNKSHSVAYARLTYQTAYLKEHAFEEFFKKFFEYNSSSSEDVFLAVQELRRKGYRVLPPDVNFSGKTLVFNGKDIVLPLTLVKGVGENHVEEITRARPIKSVGDLLKKVKGIPRNVVENLIAVGAFDALYEDRSQALEELSRGAEIDEDLLEIRSLFGEKLERKRGRTKEWEKNLLEERGLGFPLSPSGEELHTFYASLSDVFTLGMVLPVAVKKVTGTFISDGLSVCKLEGEIPEGVWVVLLSPDKKIVKIWPFDEKKMFVYTVKAPARLEKGGKNEVTVVLKSGRAQRFEGFRPLCDEYFYKML